MAARQRRVIVFIDESGLSERPCRVRLGSPWRDARVAIQLQLSMIGDRLQAHRSRLVRDHVEQQRGKIALEYLPPYAPDLNPVECIWGYLKPHAMPNFCARDLTHLGRHTSSRPRSMQRRGTLVTAFWKQAELF
jgi:hypothetical protein